MNNDEPTYRILDIIEGTCVDGPGLRIAIYFAGCEHGCPGCHNPQSWSHDAGFDITLSELLEKIDISGFNVTLSGGDPIYQAVKLKPLLEEIKKRGKTIWLYTGFLYEQLLSMETVRPLLKLIDAVVDGPFILELRDTTLPFRGSGNQRIIFPSEFGF